jgi:tRNA(adenine34) deaminase
LRAFPAMVPEFEDSPGADTSREAREFWRERWLGQTLMAVGAQDPVLGLPVMRDLQQIIKGCPEAMVLPHAGHFVQEQGAPIAQRAVEFFKP